MAAPFGKHAVNDLFSGGAIMISSMAATSDAALGRLFCFEIWQSGADSSFSNNFDC